MARVVESPLSLLTHNSHQAVAALHMHGAESLSSPGGNSFLHHPHGIKPVCAQRDDNLGVACARTRKTGCGANVGTDNGWASEPDGMMKPAKKNEIPHTTVTCASVEPMDTNAARNGVCGLLHAIVQRAPGGVTLLSGKVTLNRHLAPVVCQPTVGFALIVAWPHFQRSSAVAV